MSLPVAVTISGIDSPEVPAQNLETACGFKPLDGSAMDALGNRCRTCAADGRVELYK